MPKQKGVNLLNAIAEMASKKPEPSGHPEMGKGEPNVNPQPNQVPSEGKCPKCGQPMPHGKFGAM